jgi:5-methylcytosine-specific restriction endonuclease McrA
MQGTNYWITSSTRNFVAKRDKGVCTHCKKVATTAHVNKRGVLTFQDESGYSFHLDHKISVSDGGSHDPENLVLSCRTCNVSKRRMKIANDPEAIAIIKAINQLKLSSGN